MNSEQTFQLLGNQVAEIVLISIRNELVNQGHKMTGDLYESITYNVQAESKKAVIEFSMLDYGMIQNYGVKPENIKIGKAMIQGLTKFVEKRMGKSGKEAQSIAFAIANKMKSEGMPTKNSYLYSKNGRRLNWIGEGLKEANPKIVETINKVFEESINMIFVQAIAEISNKNSDNVKLTIK